MSEKIQPPLSGQARVDALIDRNISTPADRAGLRAFSRVVAPLKTLTPLLRASGQSFSTDQLKVVLDSARTAHDTAKNEFEQQTRALTIANKSEVDSSVGPINSPEHEYEKIMDEIDRSSDPIGVAVNALLKQNAIDAEETERTKKIIGV